MRLGRLFLLVIFAILGLAQVIEFESGGLKYQTLTRNGITVMWAHLPTHIHNYMIIQVAVSNGSPVTWSVKPENFSFRRQDGNVLPATPAGKVVNGFINRGGRQDVIKLVSAYEQGLYGMSRFQSTNGYEARRQNALAEVSSTRLKSAAAASAIVFVQTKLSSGQSTDGAIFFTTTGKAPGPGKLVAVVAGELFEFDSLE